MTRLAVPLVVAVFTISSCSSPEPGAQQKAGGGPPRFPVTAVSVTERTIPIFQEFIGSTFSQDTVQINSRVNGYIEQWLFKPGDIVAAGQLLYKIDPRTYRAPVDGAKAELARATAQLSFAREGVDVLRGESELAQAEASLIKAEQDVARVRPLVKETALPEQDLDAAQANERVARNNYRAREANVAQLRLTQKTQIQQAEAALQAAKALLETAELNLQFTEIRSPVAGRAGETKIQVGGLVSSNSQEPLTLVSPLDPIYVEFKVGERDYLEYIKKQIAAQQATGRQVPVEPLQLLLADGTVYPYPGVYRYADRAVDVQTGTLKLIGAFPNPQRMLLPGQFSRVRLRTGVKPGVFAVPQRAIQELQGLRQVMVADQDGRVKARTVTATDRVGNMWVIEKGLANGDHVIVDGLQKAMPGAQVTVKLTAESPVESAK
ncbi:MAG: efflux RND transporter periplasmic adaptor subunit [Bryobacteraceae bacterium]|nr:efflux RND transporter periplasmic adaptor subunit [Bryobacteraceae bacterium]